MKNLLIVEDDLIKAYFLINTICREIKEIRIANIALTGKETIDIIEKDDIDFIILKLKLSDMNGIEIINFIKEKNLTKFLNKIFVIVNETKLLDSIVGNEYVWGYSSEVNYVSAIVEQMKYILKNKENIETTYMQYKIIEELENLNFKSSYSGTRFLYECERECLYKDDIYDINLNKEIYPIIAEKYCKSINSIKTSIFYAINMMYEITPKEQLSKYFEYNVIIKPKTKEIITRILEKIK